MFSLRIISVDSYVSSPVKGLDPVSCALKGNRVTQVPVIRVFGVTPTGAKGCVHVHGVFPYVYVPLPVGVEDVRQFTWRLSESLEIALKTDQGMYKNSENVFNVELVQKIPFYGYYTQPADFLKITFFKPFIMKKAIAVLQMGGVLGQKFQPHEAHLPYILQFFIDYNLYGMSYLNASSHTIRSEGLTTSHSRRKMTTCQVEVDILAENITNRSAVIGDLGMNPGLAHIWEEEKTRRRNECEDSQVSLVTYENSGVVFRSETEIDLKNELISALKKRINESLTRGELDVNDSVFHSPSFASFHDPGDPAVILDSQDWSLIEGFEKMMNEDANEGKPEDDSILGSQQPESDDDDEEEIDLTQPFEIRESDSDEEIPKSGSDSDEIIFVDGSNDARSPRKRSPRKKPTTPPRYKPLDVRIQKSPSKNLSFKTIGKTRRSSIKTEELRVSTLRSSAERHSIPSTSGQKTPKARKSLAFTDSDGDSPISPCSSIDSFHQSQFFSPTCYTPVKLPPTPAQVIAQLKAEGAQLNSTRAPFYGNPKDATHPLRNAPAPTEFQGAFKGLAAVQSDLYESLFQGSQVRTKPSMGAILTGLSSKKLVVMTPVAAPPKPNDADLWIRDQKLKLYEETDDGSQSTLMFDSGLKSSQELSPLVNSRRNSCMAELTAKNSGDFKMEFQNLQEGHASSVHRYITVMSLELHINTRGSLKPNPEHDEIAAAFYSISNDVPEESELPAALTGIIIVSPPESINFCLSGVKITRAETELDLIQKLVGVVREHDPDILVGYEIEMLSWGYLVHRGFKLSLNLFSDLTRLKFGGKAPVDFDVIRSRDFDQGISGRIVLNVWRMMRHEVSLTSYSFESMMYHVLHTRVPHYSFSTLTHWWTHMSSSKRSLTLKYYLVRVEGILKILDSLDLIGRTSELASLFGIQFYEVLSRGSQFRVESMMLRLAKPLNFLAVSPSIQQRAAMRAPASLPLIMEPHSRFYSDPVIVLDFQSLYPSMMIAYNYCFSTCLGRVENIILNNNFEFGCTSIELNPKELYKVKDHIHISPAGVGFVDSTVRKGVLPRMLEEILETRLMVKASMKKHKNDKILQRVLHARQLGLKLIANVTYGYTSANFSGRMPCIEVGDSVVSKGRETLERAIKLVKTTPKWGAQVVYGDTDSLFVLVPGKTRSEAFAIGQDIADSVTADNPKPVKLKLEKVYQPCILQTKKRYVGYMYESPDQISPELDAKGIETVRRDGCIAVGKILGKSLKILFETFDLSRVKEFVCRQMAKITGGTFSLQDLTFAREYRGSNGYKPGACVPALKLSKEWLLKDPRSEPRVGERVGYVIVYGHPGLPLIRLVRSPHEVLGDPTLQLNAEYYITKVILPPLSRCLALLGVDVFSWYHAQPKCKNSVKRSLQMASSRKATISQFFSMVNCIICSTLTTTPVCASCSEQDQKMTATIFHRIHSVERQNSLLNLICFSCCARTTDIECDSLDCPIYFKKCSVRRKLDAASVSYAVAANL